MNRPETILHIGTEKTGSSAIQSWLTRNRDNLSLLGSYYPVCPGFLNHVNLAAYGAGGSYPEELRLIYKINMEKLKKQFPRKLQKEVERAGARQIILSNEHCSSILREEKHIAVLSELLYKFSSTVKVILYVRRQDHLWLSKYSTDVMVGSHRDLEFPKYNDVYDFDYFRMIELWSSVFGKDNIIVRRFGEEYFKDHDLISDFVDAAGLPRPAIEMPARKDNASLSGAQIEFLRLFNKHVPAMVDGKLNPLRGRDIGLAISNNNVDRRKFVVSSAKMKKMLDSYSESNERLRQAYFPGLCAPLFNQSDSGTDSLPETVLSIEDAVAIAAGMWKYNKRDQKLILTVDILRLVRKFVSPKVRSQLKKLIKQR